MVVRSGYQDVHCSIYLLMHKYCSITLKCTMVLNDYYFHLPQYFMLPLSVLSGCSNTHDEGDK